ncbi:hypothetical protein [Allonocardiopsis opalescens]|uniref:ABC transporter n=1 Tax=Allonocardiopsis opalescens TaxID=1144618 RepID=A0A2T0QEZ5_9ACTN|nr:hypothetical protein [Allonocardiopsis opalescens]PRY02507.1 hypothetical protein CLV72_1011109 [Allonocardiopsis opalescens]
MTRSTRRGTAFAATAVGTGLLLAGCGGQAAPAPAESAEVPHGYVEGAEETAEPQSRLVIADTGTGAVRVLDLITEEVVDAGTVEGVAGISGDGRFAYLTTADRGGAHIVDSGAWTVDHGDHSHYYRTDVAPVGAVTGEGPGAVATDSAVTAVGFGDGTVALLDRPALEDGSVTEAATIDAGTPAPAAVPFGQQVLVPGADGAVRVHGRDGAPVSELPEPCPEPRGHALTRHAAVFGCADGALVVGEDDGAFTAEKIRFADPVPDGERPETFTSRPASSTLVAPAGEDGIWVLDTEAGGWERFAADALVAVNAVGAGGPVLALTEDGVLRALDPETGEETARTELLAAPVEAGAGPAPVIQVDTSRAYVNDPASGTVYEIDYNDELRVARTFELEISPDLMVETGR